MPPRGRAEDGSVRRADFFPNIVPAVWNLGCPRSREYPGAGGDVTCQRMGENLRCLMLAQSCLDELLSVMHGGPEQAQCRGPAVEAPVVGGVTA